MRTILLIMIVLGSTCQLHSQIQSQSMTLNGKVIDLEDNKNIDYFKFSTFPLQDVSSNILEDCCAEVCYRLF